MESIRIVNAETVERAARTIDGSIDRLQQQVINFDSAVDRFSRCVDRFEAAVQQLGEKVP